MKNINRIKKQFFDLEQVLKKQISPKSLLDRMESADIASFLSYEDQYTSQIISVLIEIQRLGSVLEEMPSDKLIPLLRDMPKEHIDSLFASAQMDDLIYLLQFIEPEQQDEILARSSRREQIQKFLKYSENQAGRIMRTPVFVLPVQMSASDSIKKLRERSLEEFIFYVYCIDNDGRLIGVVSMRQVATAPADTPLEKLIKREVVSVQDTVSTRDVAKVAAHYDFLALPVVDKNQKLLGLITMDDIIDIIQDQNTANIYARAGLHAEERIHSSPWMSIKNRLPWMFVNLVLAVLASAVISLFEETMSRLIILASLKNIVASMGGNTAIQTLTVTTRGMATGDFRFTPFTASLLKELIVGLVIGIVMGVGAGAITYFWKGSLLVSGVICIAMALNCLMAVFMGSVVPILLSLFKRDPAAGSGVLVTMITDIFGFFTFLAIAQLGLNLFGVQL